MRLTLSLILVSVSLYACGADPGAGPGVPGVSVPEAGAPEAPHAPSAPSAPDAGALKK